MPLQAPLRLLELTIISAQDLPPVSKMLRTFAVAYVHPDHKLTTPIDHHGHTNPTWNYKVVFHVNDKFLKNEGAAITIEIYNLAWLRDLPIGTARLLVSNLSPPLHKNPAHRRVSLQICRPSGHLQGTLNLGVQLVDRTDVPGGEMRSFSTRNDDGTDEKDEIQEEDRESSNFFKEENDEFQHREKNPGSRVMTPKNESMSLTPDSRTTNRPETEPETRTVVTSCGPPFSVMRPLPSEVAADLKKGFYSTEWNDYGSSIFQNWTEQGDKVGEDNAKSPAWLPEDKIPLKSTKEKHGKRRPADKKTGLLSCFGNAYGFQFRFFCGSNALKKKKKNKNKIRNVNKQNVHLMSLPEENLRRFYV